MLTWSWALLDKQRPSGSLTGNLYGADPFTANVHRFADAVTAAGLTLAVGVILYHYFRNRKGAFAPLGGAVTFVAAYILFVAAHHLYLSVEFYTPDFTINTFARIVRAAGALVLAGWLLRYLPDAVSLSENRKTAEQMKELGDNLKHSLAETRAIVDSALDAIVITDDKGVLLDFNPAAEQCFGYSRDLAIGRDMAELLIPPDLRAAHRAGMLRYLATGDSRILNKRIKLRAMRADGTTFPTELTVTQQVSPTGAVRFIAFMRDITDAARTEEERLVALEEAQAAARAKSDFLAVMSHELRTPLTAIIGYTELLETEVYGPVAESQVEPLGRVVASAKHLVGLIDQVLDFSTIEAGKVRVTPEVVNLQKLIQGCCNIVTPAAQDKGLTVQCKCDPLLMLLTDNSRLQQVMLNLLTNAIKFTSQGSIKVDVLTKGKMVSISVADTGLGISEEYQDKIFEKFWQLKQGRTRDTGGAGLGLAITKKLVTSLMGDIMVQSQEGVGTTFTVILPLEMGQP